MKSRRIIKVGILPFGDIKSRTLAIARGALKPAKGDPKVWFPSIRSFANILSEENTALLSVIRKTRPASLKDLERSTGRAQSNLSRTLRGMEKYGLVKLSEGIGARGRKPLVPEVIADEIRLELTLG
jgi:predicted transcriptional regulator